MWLLKKNEFKKQFEKLTSDLFAIQSQKKELEIEKEYVEQTLTQERNKKAIEIELLDQRSRLALQDAHHNFQREKKNWDLDKERQSVILEENYARKVNEAISLLKLDSDQKVKQIELDYERALQDKDIKHREEIQRLLTQAAQDRVDFQTKVAQEYYDKLNKALVELHSKGNATTQFVQDLAMKMLERPLAPTITESRFICDSVRT
jgi:hypothetical protein